MYSDFNISSLEEVIFLLNDIVSLIQFYEKYHDGCEFVSYDEIEYIPDDVKEIVDKIKIFLYESYDC